VYAAFTVIICLLLPLPTVAGSLDDYYLSQFALHKPDTEAAKSAALAADTATAAICGTPLKHGLKRDWNLLQSGTQKILAKQLASPVLAGELTYTSAGKHFTVHYAAYGSDAPPSADANGNGVPDWVETVAATFEDVYSRFGIMGYQPAPTAAGTPYAVYLSNLAPQGYYGVTNSDIPASSANYPHSFTSWIELDNNFTDAIYRPSTYTPLQSLQVTAAHEYHHAVQYGYNYYFDIWFAEATSTWMEDELYDGVNQLYNYVSGWFTNSTKSLDLAVNYDAIIVGAGYGRWPFNRFLAEKYGESVIREVWDTLAGIAPTGEADIRMLPLIDNTLAALFNTTLADEYREFAKRIYTRDWTSHPTEVSRIPRYSPIGTYTGYPVTASSYPAPFISLPHHSYAYYKFIPSVTAPSDLPLRVYGTSGIAAAVFKKSAGIITEIPPDDTGTAFTVAGFNSLNPATDEVVLLLANTTYSDSHSASFDTNQIWTVTASTDGNGTVTCTSPVDAGAASSCIVRPASGFHLATFTDNGTDMKPLVTGNGYKIENVTGNHSIAATFSAVYTLNVTIYGDGGGSVHSSPMTTISCATGVGNGCTGEFGTIDVTLTALPDSATSVFEQWSGPCSSVLKECTFTVTSDMSVGATFTRAPETKLSLTSAGGYDTLQEAYINAVSNIYALEGLFSGDWLLDRNKDIAFSGGYRADYGPVRTGYTILSGTLTVKNGTLRVDGLKIGPL
jgi:hypothetical protein